MTSVAAALHGFFKVVGSPSVVLWLWFVNVLVALPATAVMVGSIRASVGGSLVHERLEDGFDMGWFGEYSAGAKGAEASFTPTVLGAGAFFNNIEAWFNGSMFEQSPGIVGVGVLFALMWTLFLGGILHRYSDGSGIFRFAEFLSFSGAFFFRFVRLAALSGIVYYAIYRFSAWLFRSIEDSTRDVTSEESVLAYVIAGTLLVVFMLTFVNMAFDYAKIATFHDNRRSMVLAAASGFGFVLSHFGRTSALYYGLGLLGLAMLWFYHVIAPGAGQSSTAAVLIAFAIGQIFLVAKLVLRLTFYAGQMTLYTASRR